MKLDDLYYAGGPLPETPEPADQEPWKETRIVGKALPRIDAYDRVSGTAVYTSDMVLPDMLYAAILVCPYAHAHLKRLDTGQAEQMPGVRAIISGKTPIADIPWYGSRGKLFETDCRFHGEEVAAVAAETPYQAWDAVRAIKADYEVLPYVVTEDDALKPGAPEIHPGGNRAGQPQKPYERGDVEAGFKQADIVLERTYSTACEIHSPTETHASVAQWEGGRLTVWDSTQGVFGVQSGLAQTLKLPIANVRVIGHYMGGGFGAKLGLSKQTVIAALLAKITARPVKAVLPREQNFLNVGNRPPARMTIKAGVKKDGTLTALQMKVLATGGAYAGGTGGVDFNLRELYKCPNVRTEGTDVFINAGAARPFRAPGHPQGAWGLEHMMDELAEAIKMDPVELRLKNITTVSQVRNNRPYTTTGLADCLREGAKAFGWAEGRKKGPGTGPVRRGVGVAAGMWQAGSGGPPSTVIVKVFPDGSANLNMGASDIGCGTKMWMAMIVAEELGVPLDKIQIEHADTGTTQYATPSGGSKTVPTEAPAGRAAAIDAKNQLLAMAADQLKVKPEQLVFKDGEIVSAADPAKRLALTAIEGLRRRGLVVGIGYRGPNPQDKAVNPFAAQFAEVEVNTLTGEVRVIRFLAAQDSGRVMNRLTFDNQTFGGVTMGLGLALMEERILDRARTGKMVNMNWHDYKVPTAMDVPADMSCLPIDLHDTECNTAGAKGLGEPCTIPTAPAVANAVYHATGVRVADSPIKPDRLLALLVAPKAAPKKRG
jgi:CO/xanthine dehydrogenase Mo-binding subunit